MSRKAKVEAQDEAPAVAPDAPTEPEATGETVAGEPVETFESLTERIVFGEDVFYLTNDIDECLKEIAAWEDNYCLVLANEQFKYKEWGKEVTSERPRLFRYSQTIIGTTLVLVEDEVPSLATTKERAKFGLPKLPRSLVNDIDLLFHTVDARLGSEAIVLLTFDPTFLDDENPGLGWGFLVPTQENSSGSCRYDPTSVEAARPEEAFIVGSAHSHPKMSAFASHTDEDDQLHFDGIHITFGWKSGHSPTEHHVEWQMGGTQFTMKADDIFEPEDGVPDKVLEWMKPIKKSWGTGGKAGTGSGGQTSMGTTSGTSDGVTFPYSLPKEIPDGANVVVRLLGDFEKTCPACSMKFFENALEQRRCSDCMTYIFYPNETLATIKAKRSQKGMATLDLDEPGHTTYLWERSIVGDNKKFTSWVTQQFIPKAP